MSKVAQNKLLKNFIISDLTILFKTFKLKYDAKINKIDNIAEFSSKGHSDIKVKTWIIRQKQVIKRRKKKLSKTTKTTKTKKASAKQKKSSTKKRSVKPKSEKPKLAPKRKSPPKLTPKRKLPPKKKSPVKKSPKRISPKAILKIKAINRKKSMACNLRYNELVKVIGKENISIMKNSTRVNLKKALMVYKSKYCKNTNNMNKAGLVKFLKVNKVPVQIHFTKKSPSIRVFEITPHEKKMKDDHNIEFTKLKNISAAADWADLAVDGMRVDGLADIKEARERALKLEKFLKNNP